MSHRQSGSVLRRVLHVLAPSRAGGLERVVEMLASAQGERAHVAAVLTPGDAPGHPFAAGLRAAGVDAHEIIVGGRAYRREYRELRALQERVAPEVVHTHGYRADIVAGKAARDAGIATISTLHGFTGGGFRNRLNERVQCYMLRRADAVIAVSSAMVPRLQRTGIPAERIHVVANAYGAPAPLLSRAEARARLGLAKNALVACWVGRLSNEKGPDVMVRAMPLLDSQWQLSMLGEGRDRAQLSLTAAELGIAGRIRWHGGVANAAALLAAFDAFVLSSRTEGTPIALFEAMAARVPIVATRVGGVPDVVGDAHAILVAPERPDEIARALGKIQRDSAAAARRADAARTRLVTAYDVDPWRASIDRIYNAIVR
ncbi:MAG TPA: glycosyltransferase [Gemmatimonadaceae bacterium]|nr:glycosyltransferase [Gemmatimonadaceae bacterium]